MTSGSGPGTLYERVRRFIPFRLTIIRLFFAVLLGVALWAYIDFRWVQNRTIVVDAITGALDIKLDAELSGKAFVNLWTCERAETSEPTRETPPRPVGCPSRTHHLVGPAPIATPVIPAGTQLKVTSVPGMLRIDVVPPQVDDIVRVPSPFDGGALILMDRTVLDAFGTLSLSGAVQIGAPPVETDRRSTTSGRYQIRSYAPLDPVESELRDLRGDAFLAGAWVRFVAPGETTAPGRVAIMLPNPETDLMQVTATSRHAKDTLGIRYYFTDEVFLRPSFLESLLLDPIFQVLVAVFGAIAGYGWLKKLSGVIDRGSGQ